MPSPLTRKKRKPQREKPQVICDCGQLALPQLTECADCYEAGLQEEREEQEQWMPSL